MSRKKLSGPACKIQGSFQPYQNIDRDVGRRRFIGVEYRKEIFFKTPKGLTIEYLYTRYLYAMQLVLWELIDPAEQCFLSMLVATLKQSPSPPYCDVSLRITLSS
jgi:hypothetical protein